MTIALLRVEGVNFDASVLDTNDLSTVRGGSFLLLDAIGALEAVLQSSAKSWSAHSLIPELNGVQTLIKGGSIGLFELELNEPHSRLEDLRKTVAGCLDGSALKDLEGAGLNEQLLEVFDLACFATFVVDLVYSGDSVEGFITAREAVVAANRWRQMQAPSVTAVEAQKADGRPAAERVCAFDFVRPGFLKEEHIKGKEQSLSTSVFRRRGYGLKRKFDLYGEVLTRAGAAVPNKKEEGYARSFEEIASPGNPKMPLSGKIAVFYADGNGFSRVQDAILQDGIEDHRISGPARMRQSGYDETLRHWRDLVFAAVVRQLAGCQHGIAPKEEDKSEDKPKKRRLRLETLIWAGDDGTWVVPAFFGWTLASTFFAETLGLDPSLSGGWRFGDGQQGRQLHHAAGLVFCHHDAPITRIHRLARDLAEHAKAVDRGRSLLAYQVLESFDHIGRDLEAFRRDRCPAGIRPEEMLIDGAAMAGVPAAMARLKPKSGPHLPRRQVKRLALTLYENGVGGAAEAMEQGLQNDLSDDLKTEVSKLRLCFGAGLALWLHLDDLWDFLDPPEPAAATAGSGACASTA